MRILTICIISLVITGCSGLRINIPNTSGDPQNANNYGYHPLDPLPIRLTRGTSTPLNLLPNETMRIAIGTVSSSGGISYGPAKIGLAGKNYIVVLDYIKFATASINAIIVKDKKGNKIATLTNDASQANAIVPVYIGIGLRLKAHVYVKKGSVNLGSLFSLGVAAKSNKITGTLVIQTLGISGPEISGLIPMPGEISESTIQNAILSLASIKAKIYDTKTKISPRIVGVYNTLGGGETTINGFISKLLQKPIKFPK